MKKSNLARPWFLANTVAWLLGYVLYTPIAHGLTGGHTRDLTPAQIVAHCVALAVVAVIVATAQRRVLRQYVPVSGLRVAMAAVVFIAAFWIGYYQNVIEGPDTDMLFAFFALGGAVWIGNVPTRGHRVAAVIALLSFPIAGFVGEVVLFVVFTAMGIVPAMQTSDVQHSIFWIAVGGAAGLLGGWISGLALARMVPARETVRGA